MGSAALPFTWLGGGQLRHTANLNRCGRPQIGAGCHRRNMCGVKQISARTCCAGTTGSNIAHNRQTGGEYRLDHLTHGEIETSRSVDTQDHQLRARFLGLLQTTHHMIGPGRANGALHIYHPDIRPGMTGQ